MRILLVANYEPDGQQSMARYAAWLERILKARGYQVEVTAPRAFFSSLASGSGMKKYLGYLDKFLLFPPRLRRLARWYDLIHVLDHSNSMYLRTARSKPNLITCHDVLAIRAARGEFVEERIGWSGRLLQRWILSGLRGARHILCVSAKTGTDLETLLGQRGKSGPELQVIYNALNWSYRPGAALFGSLAVRLGLLPGERYLLHVGGNQWYKNRAGVLRIFAQLTRPRQTRMDEFSTAKLVMAGRPLPGALRAAIREERLQERVIEAVDVTNEELQALYGNALALLFPSLEEGFGWPILEAQACGCPVITTFRPPMADIAGDGAILIDPADPEGAATAIVEGLEGGLEAHEQLRAAGFRNLMRFDEEAIADRYCALYKAIVNKAMLDGVIRNGN
jgi:glycosyltransferase involved in cell wall biosynthesis